MAASPEVEWHGLMATRSSHPAMTGAHLHPEVELNLLVRGSAGYVTPRGFVPLAGGRLTAFWGGFPHRLLGGDDVELLIATVPPSVVVGRPGLDAALGMLMQGHWLTGTDDEGEHDEFCSAAGSTTSTTPPRSPPPTRVRWSCRGGLRGSARECRPGRPRACGARVRRTGSS
jgi:hypothetical protein